MIEKTADLIQRVQSLYSKGVQSSDTRLSSRHIYHKLLTVRSRLLVQQSNKKQKVSSWDYQTLRCIDMIEVEAHLCPCAPGPGCVMLRSKFRLPKPMTDLNNHMLKDVMSISLMSSAVRYSEITIAEKNYKKGNKYTANKPDFFVVDGYLYVTHTKNHSYIKMISAVGLFQDPYEVAKFNAKCENCEECVKCLSPLDMEFPISGDLIDPLIELTVTEVVQLFNKEGKEDRDPTNADDDIVEQRPNRR